MTEAPAALPTDASAPRRAVLDLAPLLLALIAEGAWIALLYDLAQAARGEPATLGTLAFALFAALGAAAGRLVGPRLSGDAARLAWMIVVLMAAGAVVGWLADGGARSAVVDGSIVQALGRHQAGFLAALAVFRGTAHSVPATSERSLGRLVAWGTPALAVPLLIAQALDEPAHGAYEAKALVECLTFLLAATLGLALQRVANMGRAAGFAWDRNRVWLASAAVVALLAIVALPAAFLVGPIVRLLVAIALPLVLLGAMVASVSQITLRAIGIVAVVGLAIFALSRLALDFAQNPQATTSPPVASGANAQDPMATVISWLPIIALALVAIVLLIRRWLRRRPTTPPAGVTEERWTEPAGDAIALRPRLRLPWSRRDRSAPSDAVGAYLAALADMDQVPALARTRTETPAAHARRLRVEGVGAVELDLLAADYQLARFGAMRLSAAEERRAVGRWRRLRERIGA